jgi:Fic family protein
MAFELQLLPPAVQLETIPILKKAASAHRFLAELKGVSGTIPNEGILINTLSLQEAKDSSAIENIITTNDDLFKEELYPEFTQNATAKEVQNYVVALKKGFALVQKNRILTLNHILEIQSALEKNRAGFRKIPGTALKNEATGETVYTPPQHPREIISLMTNLEKFINDDELCNADPLVKMAVIHYQFESIHPFYDANGRTGRILNVLYLVLKELLDIPILYLSRNIIRTKLDYYRLLQKVRDEAAWEEWVLYILDSVEITAKHTIGMVHEIKTALMDYKHRIRNNHPFYSQDLINHLFFHPYTKIEFMERDLGINRITASKYLNILTDQGFLKKEKIKKWNFYVNTALYNILADRGR